METIAPSKKCFKCNQVKPLTDFYKHRMMADGHLNKCKECAKLDVKNDYRANTEAHKAYEKIRNARPDRKFAKVNYQIDHRTFYPEKYKARTALHNAIRDGILIRPDTCEFCDEKPEAHHEDYAKPLEVRWLCLRHHRIIEGRSIELDVNLSK